MSNPCLGLVVPTPPSLPTGYGIALPPLPSPPNLNLCCQIRAEDYIPWPAPPWIPFPTGAALIVINTAMKQVQQIVQNYVDSFVPECPKVPRSKRTSA